eukprot:gene9324-16457_t
MAQEAMVTDEPEVKTSSKSAIVEVPGPSDLMKIVALVEKSVKTKDTRLLGSRLMRHLVMARKSFTSAELTTFLTEVIPVDAECRTMLLDQINILSPEAGQENVQAQGSPAFCFLQFFHLELPWIDETVANTPYPHVASVFTGDMAVDTSSTEVASASTEDMAVDASSTDASPKTPSTTLIPEVEALAYLVVLMYMVDQKKMDQAKLVAGKALERIGAFNRRTMDLIASRIHFYYSWAHESTGNLADIRSTLLGLHRTAVLHHNSVGQETLMNLLLRNYLHYGLYDQAEKFRSKAQKAEAFRSHQQYCRYLFYLGRIRTIQLEYTDAKESLQQAARKAPSVAHGFRVASNKWLILVRLLLGEIPDRQEFAQQGLGKALQPYFELTQAVRNGDLVAFAETASRHDAVFRSDATRNLITRLRHNVIRTGLRRINLAYSRISLKDVAAKLHLDSADDAAYSRISLTDVAAKLHLDSADDAECIVAKAIRDGGIGAVLDHEGGFMASREIADVYSTHEPQAAFHARIAFCLDLHNEAIKAMRFEAQAFGYNCVLSATARRRLSATAVCFQLQLGAGFQQQLSTARRKLSATAKRRLSATSKRRLSATAVCCQLQLAQIFGYNCVLSTTARRRLSATALQLGAGFRLKAGASVQLRRRTFGTAVCLRRQLGPASANNCVLSATVGAAFGYSGLGAGFRHSCVRSAPAGRSLSATRVFQLQQAKASAKLCAFKLQLGAGFCYSSTARSRALSATGRGQAFQLQQCASGYARAQLSATTVYSSAQAFSYSSVIFKYDRRKAFGTERRLRLRYGAASATAAASGFGLHCVDFSYSSAQGFQLQLVASATARRSGLVRSAGLGKLGRQRLFSAKQAQGFRYSVCFQLQLGAGFQLTDRVCFQIQLGPQAFFLDFWLQAVVFQLPLGARLSAKVGAGLFATANLWLSSATARRGFQYSVCFQATVAAGFRRISARLSATARRSLSRQQQCASAKARAGFGYNCVLSTTARRRLYFR